ncbi:MAG: RHS repeat-associated core domain-containing protein, partial [Acidobacteria bacterium]|nr:RHS repeat-associated core domain-containing protein [Acidobacteriota bacterium]
PETGANGNGITLYEYDIASNLTKRTDPRGIITTYTYDTLNRLLTRSYSDSTPTASYFYDGKLPNIAPPGFTPQFAMGRTTAIVTEATAREQATGLFHTYDNVGRITRSVQLVDGRYFPTNTQYNLASLPTSHTYPSGHNIAHSYNIAGQLTDVMRDGEAISSQASYTAAGAIASHQLGNGLYHQMKYNSRLQPTEITLGSGISGTSAEDIWKQEYNYGVYNFDTINNADTTPNISMNESQNNGNIGQIKLTPGNGTNAINQFFVYDELNRLKLAKEFATEQIGDGVIDIPIFATGTSGQAHYVNDSEGAFIEFRDDPSQQTADGTVSVSVDLTDPDLRGKTVGLSFTQLLSIDRQQSQAATGTVSGSVSVDGLGSVSGEHFLTLDNNGNIVETNANFSIGLTPYLLSELGVDASSKIGQVIEITYTFQSSNVFFVDPNTQQQLPTFSFYGFSYAPRVSVRDNGQGGGQTQNVASWSQAYTYDRYGNRTQVEGTNEQELNISTSTNRITSTGYTYDSAGNLKTDPSNKYYFYDGENRLIKVSSDSAGSSIIAQYFYDASGWRVKKVASTTTRFIYNQGGALLAEYEGEPIPAINSPTKENIYAPSGLLAVVEANQTYYLTPDHLGSNRVITDSNASVITRRDFYPFGESIDDPSIGGRNNIFGYFSSNDSIRQQFTGYEKDVESDLDFAQARYFASKLGRFMQPDDFRNSPKLINPQSWNLYSYVTNNPTVYVDPTGEIIENSRDKGSALSNSRLKRIAEDLQKKIGLKSLNFVNGNLTYDKNEKPSGGSAILQDNILGAINDPNNIYILNDTTDDTSVSFAQADTGTQDSKTRVTKYNISIDFGDFASAKDQSDSRAFEAFSLGLVLFHEINHKATYDSDGNIIDNFRFDVSSNPKAVGVIDFVNQANKELGLIIRAPGVHKAVPNPGNTNLASNTLGIQFKDRDGKDKFVRFKKETNRKALGR